MPLPGSLCPRAHGRHLRRCFQPNAMLIILPDYHNLSVPTLVSFWAPWCGPCRMIKPILEQLEDEYAGKLKIAQINTDENQVHMLAMLASDSRGVEIYGWNIGLCGWWGWWCGVVGHGDGVRDPEHSDVDALQRRRASRHYHWVWMGYYGCLVHNSHMGTHAGTHGHTRGNTQKTHMAVSGCDSVPRTSHPSLAISRPSRASALCRCAISSWLALCWFPY